MTTSFTELDARRIGRVRRFFAQHPSASDVLVCLVALALTAPDLLDLRGGITAVPGRTGAGWVAVAVAIQLAAVAVLAVRRRRPVPVAAATALLAVALVLVTGTLGATPFAFALAVYVVAAEHPPRVGWTTLVVGLVLSGGALLAWGAPDAASSTVTVTREGEQGSTTSTGSSIVADVSALVVLGLVVMTAGSNVRSRRQHVRSLVDRHARLVEAGEQQARLAAATEQTRIAREMHDVVAHGLTVMVALSDGARSAVRRSPDEAEHALDLLSETGRSALADMRRMLGVLRGGDVPLEPQPGVQDLDTLVQSYRNAGMSVRLTTTGPALPTDAALALTVYRVVQESLTNALRHAGAQARVDVLVRHGVGRIGIEVLDDGGGRRAEPVADAAPAAAEGRLGRLGDRIGDRIGDRVGERGGGERGGERGTERSAEGPLVTARTGRGLVGMRERAAAYGGTVEAGPVRGGWRVRVELRTDDGSAAHRLDSTLTEKERA